MADLMHMTDEELGRAIGAYFDRAAVPADAALIADRAVARRRLSGPSLDLGRLLITAGVAAVLLLAAYQAARFVGSILDRTDVLPIESLKPDPTAIPEGPPGGTLAIPTTEGIDMVEVGTGTVLRSVGTDLDAFCLSLSPDGSMLSYFVGAFADPFHDSSRPLMQLVELRDSTTDVVTEVSGPLWVQPPTWSPDGTKFVLIHDSTPAPIPGEMMGQWSTVWLHDRNGTAIRELYSGSEVLHVAFAPDGKSIAVTTRASLVPVRIDGSAGVHLASHEARPSSKNAPSWSPDGAYIAYAVGPGDVGSWVVHVVNVVTREDRELQNTARAYYPRWSPRGDWIATTPPGGGGIDLIDPVTGEAHMLNTAGANHAWTLDGSAIGIVTPDAIRVYTPSGELILEIPSNSTIGPIDCPLAFSR
jgi:Tol biopolymer transport system component